MRHSEGKAERTFIAPNAYIRREEKSPLHNLRGQKKAKQNKSTTIAGGRKEIIKSRNQLDGNRKNNVERQ